FAFHYKINFFQEGDVCQRIAFHRNNIGILALSNAAYVILHVQQFRGAGGGGTDGLSRRHAVLNHVREFLRGINAPVKAAYVSAKSNLYACFKCTVERLFMDLEHVEPDLGSGSSASWGYIFAYENSWHIENTFLRHGFQVSIGNVVAMLHGIHASFYRVVHAIERHGV